MIVLLVFILVWLGIAVFKVFRKSGNSIVLEYFSTTSALPIRGILAIMIVLHHFSTLYGSEFPLLEQAGFWGVPVCTLFFFFSGYGLTASFLGKGEAYLQGFMKRRLSKLLIPIFIVIALHLLLLVINGQFDLTKLLTGLLRGVPILPHLWFVCALILFYCIFYASARITPPTCTWRGFFVMVLCTVIYVVIIKLLGWGGFWLASIHGFVMGSIVASQEQKITQLFGDNPKLFVSGFTVISILGFLYCLSGNIGILRVPAWGTLFCWILPLVIYILCRLCPLSSPKPLTTLGKMSFEIYLVHYGVMFVLRPMIQDNNLFFIVTIVSTFLYAVILSECCKAVNRYSLTRR